MRNPFLTAKSTRRDVEEALLHAVLVVVVALALAVALIALNNLFVLVAFAGAAAGVLVARSYEANEVRRDFHASFPDTWNASVDAVTQTGRTVCEPTWYRATEGRIRASDATLAIERLPGDVTRVRVRIGTLRTQDHRRLAALVLENVAKRLA